MTNNKQMKLLMDTQRIWYVGFCNDNEIERVLNPKTAKDYLLKQRADIISNHPRFYRVFRALETYLNSNGLENCFVDRHYMKYIKLLSRQNKERLESITYGDIFSNDFNGYASYDKKFGVIVYLNESLRYFNNFINLALLDQEKNIPESIRRNALRISIRIALKTESMDFLLDPRGIVSPAIANMMRETTEDELEFVVGHEFAHYLCGHLDNSKTDNKVFFSFDSHIYSNIIYTLSQKQEFEADCNSINNVIRQKDRERLIRAALIWFSSLELVEYVFDIISPGRTSYTHPSAKERYNKIKETFYADDTIKNELNKIRKRVEVYKAFLKEDISLNAENYEMYGSAYLDSPNTKWRGRELIDRVDY